MTPKNTTKELALLQDLTLTPTNCVDASPLAANNLDFTFSPKSSSAMPPKLPMESKQYHQDSQPKDLREEDNE